MTGIPGLLAGKVSIATGASSGLGRAIALALNSHGAIVVWADRDASSKGRDEFGAGCKPVDIVMPWLALRS